MSETKKWMGCWMPGLLLLLLTTATCICANPSSFEDLEARDSSVVVDTSSSLAAGMPNDPTQPKHMSFQRPPMGYKDYRDYKDYDYILGPPPLRRMANGDPYAAADNDLSATSALKIHGEGNLASLNRPVVQKPLPWYGDYSSKLLANAPMYPSRSYDPYIRRYDRFDEQYHRNYPQYFEDMYMHRQRFDPYDSYSPRIPQYPDPYVMYPDRYPDYPKMRRGYIDEQPPSSIMDSYSGSKFGGGGSSKPADLTTFPARNERIVYYAHLPEIVRTPYDSAPPEDRNSAAYKLNKKLKLKSNQRPLASNNTTTYKMSL